MCIACSIEAARAPYSPPHHMCLLTHAHTRVLLQVRQQLSQLLERFRRVPAPVGPEAETEEEEGTDGAAATAAAAAAATPAPSPRARTQEAVWGQMSKHVFVHRLLK